MNRALLSRPFIFLFLVTFLLSASAFSQSPITSAAEINYPPFSIGNELGQADGFSVELLREALATMNQSVIFQIGTWTDVRTMLENRHIQVLPLVARTPEREDKFDFTIPYMTLHGTIVVRKDENNIHNLKDLNGKNVAVMQGDNVEEFLLREKRNFTIHTTPTFKEALVDLSHKKYDAVIIQQLVALRLIQEHGLTNLKAIRKPISGYSQDFCFAVAEGDRKLLAILNEGLSIIIADGTHRRLHSKWFADMQLPTDRPIIIGGDRNYPPYEFIDESGRPAGYNIDLVRAIAHEMNLDIEIQLGRWDERIQALETGEIDLLPGMFYSKARAQHFAFSPPHAVMHFIAIVRKNAQAPHTLQELRDKKIIVQSGDYMHDFVIENGLLEQTTVVQDFEEALRQLASGEHDCALGLRISALELIAKNKWDNLKLGKHDILAPEYCLAVKKGNQVLLTEFNEGLGLLKESGDYHRIYSKWLGVYQAHPPSFLVVLRYSAIIIIPLLFIIFLVAMWTWSLHRQVAKKTKELQESLERFQYFFEAANVGKSITYLNGEIMTNQAFANLLGYSQQELQQKTWQEITPPEQVDEIENLLQSILTGEKQDVRFQKQYIRKDGVRIWADVSTKLRREKNGKPSYFVTTIVDITEQKHIQKALQKSEEFQRALVTCSPVALYSIDLQGKILTWNESAEKLFGWTAQDVLYKHIPTIPEDKRHEYNKHRNQVLDEGGFSDREVIRQTKSGERIPISLSAAPIYDDHHEIIGIMGAAQDLRERKQAEQTQIKLRNDLFQAQKLESIGRLAGGVAHDFNNLLSVILGHTELLLEERDENDPIHEDLNEIHKAAMRSAEVTKKLLAFARKQAVNPQVIDLNKNVDGMLTMLHRLIGENIKLSWLPAEHAWPIKIDPSQVDQILANLCVNSRDAIADVGEIRIETSNIIIDNEYCKTHSDFKPGEYVQLTVSDNGTGISKETLSHIFEPFYTTKSTGKGTGLGLATIYGIIKQNNGLINVYSEPENGTTFKIFFKHYQGDENAAPKQAPEQIIPDGKNETILLVEDDTEILSITVKMLKNLNYKILVASNPHEALLLAEDPNIHIDLLITDVIMPEMNGKELAIKLESQIPGLKIIYMSGYTADVIANQGILEQGVIFLQKPFTKIDMATQIRNALEKNFMNLDGE